MATILQLNPQLNVFTPLGEGTMTNFQLITKGIKKCRQYKELYDI